MNLLTAIAAEARTSFISDYAETATYTPAAGSARSVAVVFDLESDVADIGEMIERDGVAARATVATADVSEIAIGDVMAVRGVSYNVVGVEPDGTGHTVLRLGI